MGVYRNEHGAISRAEVAAASAKTAKGFNARAAAVRKNISPAAAVKARKAYWGNKASTPGGLKVAKNIGDEGQEGVIKARNSAARAAAAAAARKAGRKSGS